MPRFLCVRSEPRLRPARLRGGNVTAPESKKARLAAALAECNKVCDPAWAEYMVAYLAAVAKRRKVCDPAWDEYTRKLQAIEAEP